VTTCLNNTLLSATEFLSEVFGAVPINRRRKPFTARSRFPRRSPPAACALVRVRRHPPGCGLSAPRSSPRNVFARLNRGVCSRRWAIGAFRPVSITRVLAILSCSFSCVLPRLYGESTVVMST